MYALAVANTSRDAVANMSVCSCFCCQYVLLPMFPVATVANTSRPQSNASSLLVTFKPPLKQAGRSAKVGHLSAPTTPAA